MLGGVPSRVLAISGGAAVRIVAAIFGFVLLAGVAGAVGALYLLHQYSKELPEYQQLAEYDPPTVTRVHAGDGRLLTEYAIEKRVFVPIQAMPRRILNAFISAEDKKFYEHQGVDFQAVGRAVITNVFNYIRGRRPVGASTITQQVAKNFLLTNEISYERKLKEAILAFRIERAFTKDRILELYLNEIYLGLGSYGVAAASLKYFGKSLDELSIAEAAYLAALPKAPNNYHPILATEAAIARRNWVIGRMLSDGRVTPEEAEVAAGEPLVVKRDAVTLSVDAGYFAEEVRRQLVDLYGDDRLYQGGLSVRTTLDARLQMIAERALRQGLIDYDRRHGWRGALAEFDLDGEVDWQTWLAEEFQTPAGAGDWRPAVVLEAGKKQAKIGLEDGTSGYIPFAEVAWAQPWLKDQSVGKKPSRVTDVLKAGDVILVEAVEADAEGKAYDAGAFALRQIPDVDGGIVALDPHTGRVLAMVGGFSYQRSEFNRVTQAKRQPGSAFKPVVYLAGLDNGFTPATLILDAPFVIDQGEDQGLWKPDNYSNKFYGPTPMRVGIEKSRNLMTVRLAETIGMKTVAEYAMRLGVVDHMPRVLAMALGSGETTLMRLTTAYAMLGNVPAAALRHGTRSACLSWRTSASKSPIRTAPTRSSR
jgi:penicillin-binding protein 1A